VYDQYCIFTFSKENVSDCHATVFWGVGGLHVVMWLLGCSEWLLVVQYFITAKNTPPIRSWDGFNFFPQYPRKCFPSAAQCTSVDTQWKHLDYADVQIADMSLQLRMPEKWTQAAIAACHGANVPLQW